MNRCDVWIEDKWQPKTTNQTHIAICCSLAIHLSDQSTNFLIVIKNHRLTHTCMNQSSPICVLYLSDASNNEENGRKKGENSDHTHFSVLQNFFYPHKDKNPSLQRQLHFLSTKTKQLPLHKS